MTIAVHRRRVLGPRNSPQLQIDNDLSATRAYIRIYHKIKHNFGFTKSFIPVSIQSSRSRTLSLYKIFLETKRIYVHLQNKHKIMENEFVTYEQAVALKELGFNEECFSLYFNNGEFSNFIHAYKVNDEVVEKTNSVLAPLKQQVFRWFREKYNLEIILCPDCFNEPSKLLREYKIISIDKSIVLDQCTDQKHWIRKGCFVSYEEAENACIDKLIELAKEQADEKI